MNYQSYDRISPFDQLYQLGFSICSLLHLSEDQELLSTKSIFVKELTNALELDVDLYMSKT